jgi:c-di-AMP phosphodiesterase-like protein
VSREDRQINIRVSAELFEVLEAAAYVQRKGSPRALVEEQVAEAVARYAKLETVKKAIQAQREETAAGEGKLSHIAAPRRTATRGRRTRTSDP